MVRVENLGKDFKDAKKGIVQAIKTISFEAMPGQVFGLIGDNGAGKTTTLRILSTVIEPSRGSASVAGFDVTKDPKQVRASIGFLSGTTGLYGRLTPREILMYFGGLYGLEGSALTSRVNQLIDELSIGEFVDRVCDKLSTGQKQRVGIARTVLHNPPVLFLDEPTSGLDVAASQAMMEFIERSRDAGKTIIFSSHIMSEVERLCDKIVIMHEGAIFAEGTVESVKAGANSATMEKAFLNVVGYYSSIEVAS